MCLKNLLRMNSIRSPQPLVLEHLATISKEKRSEIRVLDLPCGNGVMVVPLKMAGFDVIGSDLFPEYAAQNLEKFKKEGFLETFKNSCKGFLDQAALKALFGEKVPAVPESIEVKAGNLEDKLPFDNSQFDIVTFIEGIEHLDAQFEILKELNRILKDGGKLIISTPNPLCVRTRISYAFTGQRTFKTFIDEYTEVKDISEDKKRIYHGHVFLIDYFELRYLLHHAGFKISKLLPFPPSLTSLILLPFWWPIAFIMFQVNLYFARRKFKKLKKAGKISADAKMPYCQILSHIFSPSLMLGSVYIIEAEKT